MSWLLGKGLLGIPRWGLLTALLAAIAGGVVLGTHIFDKTLSGAQEAGRAQERAAGLGQALQRTEEGNDTRSKVEGEARAGRGDALYRQCLRDNRSGPAACQRFLPQ